MSDNDTSRTSAADAASKTPGDSSSGDGGSAKGGWHQVWREWLKPFLMVLLVVGSLRSAVADWNDVPTGSMRPTILEGERIFVNKLAYDLKVPFTTVRVMQWGSPQRGDVVVLYSPADGKRLVKRVMGLPGDEMAMRGGRLYINGVAAEYQPLADGDRDTLGLEGEPQELVVWETIDAKTHPVTWTPYQPAIRQFGPIKIPDDSFFVMGDNRDNSRDSRWFGFVKRDLIVGRAMAVVVSLNPEHSYSPRWDRFFLGLP
jgi:signal peptidase I